jgi:hypothetical protein
LRGKVEKEKLYAFEEAEYSQPTFAEEAKVEVGKAVHGMV